MAEKSSKKMAAAPVAKAASSGAAAAKAAPAPVAKPVAPPPAAAQRTAAPVAAPKGKVDAKERQRLIAEAAYYRAQKRGFAPGHEVQDWVAAEKEVDARIAAAK
jgi:hypothetical protein